MIRYYDIVRRKYQLVEFVFYYVSRIIALKKEEVKVKGIEDAFFNIFVLRFKYKYDLLRIFVD